MNWPSISKPALKGSAFSAAGITAGLAGFGLWHRLTRKPLPQTEGRLQLEGLDAPVDIVRDRYGVPHVRARSLNDLVFSQGFCHGQDRLFQLDFFRRAAGGQLSELAGPEMLQADRLMRTLGLARTARAETASLPAGEMDLLEAYAEGINAAVTTARALPIEMQLAKIEPRRWAPADSLAIGKLLALGFSTNWELELFRSELLNDFGPEFLQRIEPQYPRHNPVVMKPGEPYTGRGVDMAAQIGAVREAIGFGLEPAGSNNWVVSGKRSVTGRPLLASDPHVTSTMPGFWYQMHFTDDESNIFGATLPGYLGVVIGQSDHVAWGFTNAMADVMDLFTERVRRDGDTPSDVWSPGDGHRGPVEYEYRGKWRRAAVIREEIRIKGKAEPELLEVVATHHGPIINHALQAESEPPLALSWTALMAPIVNRRVVEASMGRVRSGAEVVDAMADYVAPSSNMVWADSEGNIGYKLVGHIPVRKGHAPDVPKPGWTGEFEWQGVVPYEELPSLVNPDSGFIVTANNRIVDDDYPHHITSEWFDGYRARRIEDLLAVRERHSLDDFAHMQVDVYSIPGAETARSLSRLRPKGQREVDAIKRLKTWDGFLDSETIAGTIVHAFTMNFARAVSSALIGNPKLEEKYLSKSATGFLPVVSSPWRFHTRLMEIWAEGDHTLIGGRSWDELALESLESALDELEEQYGRNPRRWKWGEVHGLDFHHPFGEANRLMSRIFNRTVKAGGSTETVAQVGYVPTESYRGVWTPSYRLLADLADTSQSRWQLATGQSGHVGSKHYDDLMESFLEGRTNSMLLSERGRQAAGETKTLHLEPA